MSSTPDRPLAVIDWQTRDHAEQLKSIRHWRGNTDIKIQAVDDKIGRLGDDLRELSGTVAGLRRTLMTFAFTIAGSSVVFALSILAATGRI